MFQKFAGYAGQGLLQARDLSAFLNGDKSRAFFKRGLGPVKMWCSWSSGPTEFYRKKVFDPNGAVYSQTESASVM